MQSSADVSGAAFLPAGIAARSRVAAVAGAGHGLTFLRLEGFAPSVEFRAEMLTGLVKAFGEVAALGAADSQSLWREIRDVALLADRPQRPLWRVSVPPASGHLVMAAMSEVGETRAISGLGGRPRVAGSARGAAWLCRGYPSKLSPAAADMRP